MGMYNYQIAFANVARPEFEEIVNQFCWLMRLGPVQIAKGRNAFNFSSAFPPGFLGQSITSSLVRAGKKEVRESCSSDLGIHQAYIVT